MEILIIVFLLFIFISLLAIEALLRKQLKQTKNLEDAIYRLIEITKSK